MLLLDGGKNEEALQGGQAQLETREKWNKISASWRQRWISRQT